MVRRLVERNATVLGLDKVKPAEAIEGEQHVTADLVEGVPQAALDFAPQAIFHLAAVFERSVEFGDFWISSFDNNALASSLLLRAVAQSDQLESFQFASSYLNYDPRLYTDQPEVRFLCETDPVAPRNLVGTAKYLTERELEFVASQRPSMRYVSARICRVYGCGSRDIISRWVRAALDGEPIELWGADNIFDYIYADDVAEGMIRLCESDANGAVNLGSGRPRAVRDVVEAIRGALPELEVRTGPAPEHNEQSCLNMEQFEKRTGWRPPTDLPEGIGRIIEYERSRRS
jgi:nucleoside-diphosphate-sugar epimerase